VPGEDAPTVADHVPAPQSKHVDVLVAPAEADHVPASHVRHTIGDDAAVVLL
jgi:hypothetical protein